MKTLRCFLFACVFISAGPGNQAFAQLGGIDAEFAGAGARPLAMGGSFLALADDSTAAEFNPAGIRILRRPEFAWQVTRTFDRRREYLPESSNEMDFPVYTNDENIWNTPSFVSYVHPGQKYTWALSQLTTINFVHRFDDPDSVDFGDGIDRFLRPRTESQNNSFGLTFATDIKPRLHVGATLRMNHFHGEHQTQVFADQELDDWSPNLNLGVLWRANKDWSFGAVFKSSQEVSDQVLGVDVSTKLPETWGMGMAYHPNDKLRILADVDYINWSEFDTDLMDGFRRNDVTRFHFGGEYLLTVNDDRAWFARAGVMREESNALYYSRDPGHDDFSILFQQGFPAKDELNHLSVGVGLAKEKYQLDLAVDQVLDGATTLILAMIHYF